MAAAMALASPAEVPRLSAVLRARLASGASASSSGAAVGGAPNEPFDVDSAFLERAATRAALRRGGSAARAASVALARRLFGASSWAAAPEEEALAPDARRARSTALSRGTSAGEASAMAAATR